MSRAGGCQLQTEHWSPVYLVVSVGDGAGNVGPVHGAVEGDVFPEIALQLLDKEGCVEEYEAGGGSGMWLLSGTVRGVRASDKGSRALSQLRWAHTTRTGMLPASFSGGLRAADSAMAAKSRSFTVFFSMFIML